MSRSDANLLIGTPCYNGDIGVDRHTALLSTRQAGLRAGELFIETESLLPRARNAIACYFHAHPEYTHLLFLDADIGIEGGDVARMLDAGKDAIGCHTPLKQAGAGHSCRERLGSEGSLIVYRKVATAVLLLSGAAIAYLVSISAFYKKGYNADDPLLRDIPMYDIFRCGVVDEEYLSEDYWVTHALNAAGYPVYVDPSVRVRHKGSHTYTLEEGG